MTTTAIILILISAVIHAGWNLITKKDNPSGAFFLVGTAMAAVLMLPGLIYFWPRLPLIPGSVWVLLIITGFFNGLYYFSLAWAYRHGDLSLAYPLAKSVPTILLMVLAFFLGNGHNIGGLAIGGIVLIVFGCAILPLRRIGEFRLGNYFNFCCLLAGLAAVGTTGYTFVDNRALALLKGLPGTPYTTVEAAFLYLILIGWMCTLWLGLGVLLFKAEHRHLRDVLRTSKLNALFLAFGMYGAYILILIAMRYVTDVTYVSAFRQTCILFGAVLGITWLKEEAYPAKLAGIVAIFVGLVMVTLG
jgi:drug/metabolite transporter (DMT)-like permease